MRNPEQVPEDRVGVRAQQAAPLRPEERVGVRARHAPPLLLALVLLSAGCSGVQVRGPEVTDGELQRSGQWTKGDALARALLDLEAPPHLRGKYPVRLVPTRRKLLTEVQVGETTIFLPRIDGITAGACGEGCGVGLEVGFLAALLGLDYERRYQYVAAVNGYVILNRERAATVVSGDVDGNSELPAERTPPRAFRELNEELERDLQAIHAAAERAQPLLEPELIVEP